MKMKKGFTLVELIISISLILIVGVIGISFYLKKDNSKEENKEKEKVKDSLNVFYQNNISNPEYKSYKSKTGETYSCIRFETLLNDGLVNKDDFKNYNNDDIFIYTIDNEGISTFEKWNDEENPNACSYYLVKQDSSTLVEKPESNIGFKDKSNHDWNAEYSYKVEATDEENSFDGEINFKMKLVQQISVTQVAPLYVAVLLDNSGSMRGDGIINATNAVTSMISYFKSSSISSKIKMAAIAFDDGSSVTKNFTNVNTLSNYADLGLSARAYGGTNCSGALIHAKNIFNGVTDSGAVKVAVFLTDGVCNSGSSTSSNAALLKANGVQLFSIGYGDYVNPSDLRSFASSHKSCNTSCTGDTCSEEKCYFTASTSSVSSIFEQLAQISIEQSITNPYNQIEFKLELSDYFDFDGSLSDEKIDKEGYYYQDKIVGKTLTRTITITNPDTVKNLDISDFNYKIKFLSDIYQERESTDISVGNSEEVTLNLVKSLKIKMSGSDISSTEVSVGTGDLPKIKVDLSNNSVVN